MKNHKNKGTNYKTISQRTDRNDEVIVYTNIIGQTISVGINDEKADIIAMSNLMLQDILAVEIGCCGDTLLSSIDGIKSSLYSSAFTHMLYLIKNSESRMMEEDLPQSINTAVESLSKNEKGLKTSCEKLAASGVYPGSPVYTKLLHTKYYVEAWSRQLEKMVSFATKSLACNAVSSCTI